MSAAHAGHGPPPIKTARQDQTIGVVAAATWSATAVKMAPHMPLAGNIQTLLGAVSLTAICVAWPALRPASYARWRLHALAILHLSLVCLPVNFDTTVFDVLAPGVARGWLAWPLNISHALQGTHVLLLLLPPLGWRMPLRVHMPLQAAKLLVLAAFGVHPHCRSKLFMSPPVVQLCRRVHEVMSLLVGTAMPLATAAPVPGQYTQTVAVLLFWWAMLGWVMPTLVLLAPDVAQRQRRLLARTCSTRHGEQTWLARLRGHLAGLSDAVEYNLCGLLSPATPPLDGEVEAEGAPSGGLLDLPAVAVLAVRWTTLVFIVWIGCWSLAPLYPSPG